MNFLFFKEGTDFYFNLLAPKKFQNYKYIKK